MDAGIDRRLESKLGFDRIRTLVAGRCQTDYAAQRAEKETFCTDARMIRKRLVLTDETRLALMFEDSFPTTGYIDAIPFLTLLDNDNSCIDVHNLAKLKTVIDTVRRILAFLSSVKEQVYPNLKGMSRQIVNYPEVGRRIETILDKYGEIKDSASDELFSIRRSLRDKEAEISKRAAAILRKAREDGFVDDDASVTIREGKFLIPVNTASKRKIPGLVFDESATGKTSFVEPAGVVEIENEIIELRFAEQREIDKILRAFTEFLRPYIPEMIKSAAFLGEIDFLMAKAQVSLDFAAGIPLISEDGSLHLRKARHPLLEAALKKDNKQIVPLTVDLSGEKHILLISGPNAGGKSVCLKTTGLLQYMFQWGMLIPTSETSELPVFERIIVSIGDDQSLENDLSTYSSFLEDMKEMLAAANDKTLVLIDEFGSGTEPAAGGAIAEAILAAIDKKGVYGVITTHYTNLKLYASSAQTGVVNGAMLFDSSRIEPLFKLEIGLPGNSFAFELARKMRLPEDIVKDAEMRAGEEFVGIERNLRKIARNRRALDEKLQKVKHADRALEGLTERYQQELEDIKAQRDKILLDARLEAESIVKGAGSQVEKTIRVIKETQADREKTKEARSELQGFIGALQQKKTRDAYLDRKLEQMEKLRAKKMPAGQTELPRKTEPFKIGEKVRVIVNGAVGEVIKVSPKAVTVAIGSISSTMPESHLERISSNEYKAAVKKAQPTIRRTDPAITERRLGFRPEIDLRGARLADALEQVMHFVDDAIMLDMNTVRILHGKGTGVLHEEIQKYLRTVPGVKTVRDEDIRQGGSGVTIVEFL